MGNFQQLIGGFNKAAVQQNLSHIAQSALAAVFSINEFCVATDMPYSETPDLPSLSKYCIPTQDTFADT